VTGSGSRPRDPSPPERTGDRDLTARPVRHISQIGRTSMDP
jgi:hypothetical protein